MREIRDQVELAAFYRFAVEHPDVWNALEKQRLEHSKFGSGTLKRYIPSVDPKSESLIEVYFDARAGSEVGARPKRLAAGAVFKNNILKSLTVLPSLMNRFRAFAIQENWKKDWRRFEEVLKKHRIEHLYHFTDIRNLDSIREHGGLYSWWRCKGRGIRVSAPGSDERSREKDREKGLQDYVRLSFGTHNPMMYTARKESRIKVPRILWVSASVVYYVGEAGRFPVEAAFQGSKVFEKGGPYRDMYELSGREIKREERLKDSGALEGFDFLGDLWNLKPRTAFYEWLYVRALSQHPELAAEATRYTAFSDIEFNPKKSINCQAKSVALFVSLLKGNLLDRALSSKDAFLELVGSPDRLFPA